MSEQLVDLSVGSFLARVAASGSTPAGGAVAGVVVAAGAALVAMAARTSTGMPDGPAIAERADALGADAMRLADDDALAYSGVLEALRLPDAGDRRQRLAAALVHAAAVPLAIIEAAREVTELAAQVATGGKPAVREDAIAGALLSTAAAHTAARMVRANVAQAGLGPERVRRADAACAAMQHVADRLSTMD